MEIKLQPSALSAVSGMSSNSISQGNYFTLLHPLHIINQMKKIILASAGSNDIDSTYKYLKSTGQVCNLI